MCMKKIMLSAIAAAMVLVLAACSSHQRGEVKPVDTTAPSDAATTQAQTTAEVTTAVLTTEEPTTEEPTTIPEKTTAPFDYGSELFGSLPNQFIFSSGAGAWATLLNINSDGSFNGNFHDSDMGVTGVDYPGGTVRYCDFTGQFGEVEKVNDYTYSMKILDMEYANEPDTEEIKEQRKYIYQTAYGLDEARELLVYTPDAPVSELPEQYLGWVRRLEPSLGSTLGFYGIYNVTEEEGFIENLHQ